MSKGYSDILVFFSQSLFPQFFTFWKIIYLSKQRFRKRWNLFEDRYYRKKNFFEWLCQNKQVYFCFVASRKDSSLHSSWRDFEAGIAKCTGNDGPWRRYEWIYGMAATGVAGAPRLWPRSSAFSSSRYCCTVSRLTIHISNAYAIRRFPSCPLSSSPNRSCNL